MRLLSVMPVLFLAGFMYAQTPDKERPANDPNSPKVAPGGRETTLQGCLTKGTGQDAYVLKEDKTNTTVVVMGSADMLDKHMNHTVTLTGTETTDNGRQVFKVTNLTHVSATCGKG
jgi:hypothetical protein